MTFTTLMYHELRKEADFNPDHPSYIDVKQDYQDILPPPLFCTLEHFEDQMAFLHNNGFHTLSLDEVKVYYKGNSIPERSILITFDDCFQSMKEYGYPILKKYNFHAVAFVVTSWLHTEPKGFDISKSVCLNKQDLSLMSDVFEYANHTDTFHQRSNTTTSLMMEVADEDFANDLDVCNQFVDVQDVFAYPFGLFNERNISLLKKKGFTLAFTCEEGLNERNTNTLLLKRNVIPYFLNLDAFKKIVS